MIVRYMIFNWGRPWLISQCRWAIPEYFILPRYLERSPMLYGREMREPFWDQGDIPELVAAGRVAGCHILVMVHKAVGDKFLSTIQISINGLEVRRNNTFHLLRGADGRFHALELAPNDKAPDEPSNIQRGGSSESDTNTILQGTAMILMSCLQTRSVNNEDNFQQTITITGQGPARVIGSSTTNSSLSKRAKLS
jgi:hypothetical protein